jgi:hypothetical protein
MTGTYNPRAARGRADKTNKKFLLLFSKRSTCSFLKKEPKNFYPFYCVPKAIGRAGGFATAAGKAGEGLAYSVRVA